MKSLEDAELRMAAEIVTEIAKGRGPSYDRRAAALAMCRAALADPAYRARLAEVHRRLEARRASKENRRTLAPIAPLFRDLERDVDAVLSGWREPE